MTLDNNLLASINANNKTVRMVRDIRTAPEVALTIAANFQPGMTADNTDIVLMVGDGVDSDGDRHKVQPVVIITNPEPLNVTAYDDLNELALSLHDIYASFTDHLGLDYEAPTGFTRADNGQLTGLRTLSPLALETVIQRLTDDVLSIWHEVEATGLSFVFIEEYQRLLKPVLRRWAKDAPEERYIAARQCPQCEQYAVHMSDDEPTVAVCDRCPWSQGGKLWLGVQEAADLVGKTKKTLYNWIEADAVTGRRQDGEYLVEYGECFAYARRFKTKAAAKNAPANVLNLPDLLYKALHGLAS